MAGASQAELKIILSAQNQASAAIKDLGGALSNLGSIAGRSAAPGFGAMAAALTVANVGAAAIVGTFKAVTGAIGDTVGAAAGFESSLNNFQAVSGASAEQMARAAAEAKALGADMTLPATSAADAAKAMAELVKAGVDVDQALDATKGTLQLAAAGQIDEARAAQITAAALNTFGLAGKDAGRVADELATAANASAADMTDLAAGMQQAGFIFKATNRPIEELLSSLALLTNAGLTGSDAGTALKNAFTRMINPTKEAATKMDALGISFFDAQGNLKPLPTIIDHLNDRLAGMTQEERANALSTIFMSDGYKALQPLLDAGGDKLRALEERLKTQGAAADLAGAKTKGLQGAMDGFNSQVETLQITLGQKFGPTLEKVVRFAADGLGAINDAVEGLDLTAVFGSAQRTMARLGDGFYAAGQRASVMGEALQKLPGIGQGIDRSFNIVGSVLTGIAALMRGDAKGAVEAFGDAFGQAGQGLSDFSTFVNGVVGSVLNAVGRLAGVDVSNVGDNFDKLGTILDGVATKVDGKVNEILTSVGKLLGITFAPDASTADKFTAVFDEIGRRIDGFKNDVGSKIDALSKEIGNLKISDDVQASFKTLADSSAQIGSGVKQAADAIAAMNTALKDTTGVGALALALKAVSLVVRVVADEAGNLLKVWGNLGSALGNTLAGLTAVRTALFNLGKGDLAGAAKSTQEAQQAFAQAKTSAEQFGEGLLSVQRPSQETSDAIGALIDQLVNGPARATEASNKLAAAFNQDSEEIAAGMQQIAAAGNAVPAAIDPIAEAVANTQETMGELPPTVEQVTTSLSGGFDSAAAQVQRSLDGINTSLGTVPPAAEAAASGFETIPAAADDALGQLPGIAETNTQGVVTAVETGTTDANASAQSGLEQMVSVFLSNFAETANAAELGMADTTAATDTGMAQTVAAVETQAPQMTAAMDATGQAMTASTEASMADVLAATNDGMSQVPPAVAAQEAPAGAAGSGVGGAITDGVLGQLAGLASSAASAGAGMVSAFASGVTSNLGAALSAARQMVQEIRSLLPGSDAEKGPLSDLTASGRALPETLAKGILQAAPDLTRVFRTVFPATAKAAITGLSGDLTTEFQRQFPQALSAAASSLPSDLTATFKAQFQASGSLPNDLTQTFKGLFPTPSAAAPQTTPNDLTEVFKQLVPPALAAQQAAASVPAEVQTQAVNAAGATIGQATTAAATFGTATFASATVQALSLPNGITSTAGDGASLLPIVTDAFSGLGQASTDLSGELGGLGTEAGQTRSAFAGLRSETGALRGNVDGLSKAINRTIGDIEDFSDALQNAVPSTKTGA